VSPHTALRFSATDSSLLDDDDLALGNPDLEPDASRIAEPSPPIVAAVRDRTAGSRRLLTLRGSLVAQQVWPDGAFRCA